MAASCLHCEAVLKVLEAGVDARRATESVFFQKWATLHDEMEEVVGSLRHLAMEAWPLRAAVIIRSVLEVMTRSRNGEGENLDSVWLTELCEGLDVIDFLLLT